MKKKFHSLSGTLGSYKGPGPLSSVRHSRSTDAPRSLDQKRNHPAQYIGLLILFIVLLYLCWLFPITGDDWYREELGRNIHNLSDLIDELVFRWSTTNGRICGNILAYSAGSRKIFREIMRGLFTFGVICITARQAGFRSLWGVLLTTAALLALPSEMFRQIYPWAAGFFNYVPPVVILLAAFWLMRPVFDEKGVKESIPRAIAVFLLGFSGQLFIENNTLYAICAGFVLLVWYGYRQRKLSPVVLSFFIGTLLGAVLLFLSPSYGLIWQSGGYETGLSDGIAGLVATARGNQREVLHYLISGCPVLFVSLTVLGLIWFARSARRWPDWIAAAVLVLGCLYFSVNCATQLWIRANPLVVVVWGLALAFACLCWMPSGSNRNKALFFGVSSAVAAFPLLFVLPIGPRCLYLSYVFLLLTAGCMLTALPLDRLPALAVKVGTLLLAAAILCYYLWLFIPIHDLELVRNAALEQAIATGQTEITLPSYPHKDYLWDGDSYKVYNRYYYETPGDLSVCYVPAEEWYGAQ